MLVDLSLLTSILDADKPEKLWFYDDCIVDKTGIFAKPLDKYEKSFLTDDELLALKGFKEDIKLSLPCTMIDLVKWCKSNSCSDKLIHSCFGKG